MDFKKIKAAGNRISATVGILGALGGLGGDPVVRNSSTGLGQQYAKYAKDVRLPSSEKEIARILRTATREKGTRLKGGYSLNDKDIKKLK